MGLHTFIRIPIAALLAYRATTQLTPQMQVAGNGSGRRDCSRRTWLQDSGAGAGYSESGAGVKYCPE